MKTCSVYLRQMAFLLLFAIVPGLIFTTCKKGEDDPKLSLLSRKARVVGSWKIKSGTAIYSYYGYTAKYILDGSTQRLAIGNTLPKTPYTLDLHISKKGTFTFTEFLDSLQLTASGTWCFNAGVGEEKSKESITFIVDEAYGSRNFQYHFFNRAASSFTYRIRRLTNKEMILFGGGKMISYNAGDDINLKTEFTLESKK